MNAKGYSFPVTVCVAGGLALAFALVATAADRIHLKNGRTLEGIVREETAMHIVLELSSGSMTLPRARIARIERGDQTAHDRLRDEWRDRNWLHANHVPTGFEKLAAQTRAVADRRRDAMRARETQARDAAALRKQERQAQDLRHRLTEVAKDLEAAGPGRDPARYNARVAEHNRIQAELALLQGRRDEHDRRQAELSRRIQAYRDALLEARAAQATAAARKPGSPDGARFLERVEEALAGFDADFSTAEIQADREPGGLVVTAVINGRTHGRFIVDTGAGMVTMTRAFAEKLGVDWRALPTGRAILADGTAVETHYLLLDSVEIGRFRVPSVQAAILPATAQENADGLLGMSFLRHFHVSLDGQSGRIVLREFGPRSP